MNSKKVTQADVSHESLHLAIQNKRIKLAKSLIEAGADVNEKNDYGDTPLIVALEVCINLVKTLIKFGANVNEKRKDGDTPLLFALISPRATIVTINTLQILLEAGADVNAKDVCGNTPLLRASVSFIKGVELLVKFGANVNEKNRYGDTPLHSIIRNTRVGKRNGRNTYFTRSKLLALKTLVHAGADLEVRDHWGFTPLLLAAYDCVGVLVEQLAKLGANVHVEEMYGNTPLDLITNGATNLQAAEALLVAGADVNHKNSEGMAPLMECVRQYGRPCVAKLFIKYGANVNEKDKDGNTPLLMAISRIQFELVKTLLDAGADVNVQNIFEKGEWCTRIAPLKYTNIIKYLIDCRIDVREKDAAGYSALYYAVNNNDFIAVEAIIQADFLSIDTLALLLQSIEQHRKYSVPMTEVLIKYIVLFERHFLMPEYFSTNREFLAFKDRCEEEIEELRNVKLFDQDSLTLYDVLCSANPNSLVARLAYMNNLTHEDISKKILKNSLLKECIPVYWTYVLSLFRKCVRRKEVLPAFNILMDLVCRDFKRRGIVLSCKTLPDLIKNEITNYLSTADLTNVAKCIRMKA